MTPKKFYYTQAIIAQSQTFKHVTIRDFIMKKLMRSRVGIIFSQCLKVYHIPFYYCTILNLIFECPNDLK
jgi:hypothetical protein